MRTITVGRGPNNDVTISDSVVSSVHAKLIVNDFGEVSIEDLNSTNGTFVNGVRIHSATKLASGSTVVLGNHSIDWKQIISSNYNPKGPAVSPKSPVVFPQNVVEKKSIGRGAAAEIKFSSDEVSSVHAFLCRTSDGKVFVVDNNSTNGTFVNGSRISGYYELKKGDTVTITRKYALNWEAVYHPKKAVNIILAAVAVAVAAAVVAVVFLVPNLFPKDWSKIYAQHKHDVVMIYCQYTYAVTVNGQPLSSCVNLDLDNCCLDESGKLVKGGTKGGFGTGFFISNDGTFLTNRHVVSMTEEEAAECEQIKAILQSALIENGLTKVARSLNVEYTIVSVLIAQNDTQVNTLSDLIPCYIKKVSDDEDLDVAILQTNKKKIPDGSTYVDLSKAVSSKDLKLGELICTIGFPKSTTIGSTQVGLEANNQSGEITQDRGAYLYGHNISIHQGASGSPVFDKRGRFAGIIVSGFLGISQGFNHAIHPTPVVEFVKKYN